MAPKDKQGLDLAECVDVGKRMVAGFENAVGATKKKLAGNTRLLVGIRGALGAVREETNAGWIIRTLGRVLSYKGVTEEDDD